MTSQYSWGVSPLSAGRPRRSLLRLFLEFLELDGEAWIARQELLRVLNGAQGLRDVAFLESEFADGEQPAQAVGDLRIGGGLSEEFPDERSGGHPLAQAELRLDQGVGHRADQGLRLGRFLPDVE